MSAAVAASGGTTGASPVPGHLRWRCRRGMKELDIVLVRYLHTRWSTASVEEQLAFERTLELPDPVLAGALLRGEATGDAQVDALMPTLVTPR